MGNGKLANENGNNENNCIFQLANSTDFFMYVHGIIYPMMPVDMAKQ